MGNITDTLPHKISGPESHSIVRQHCIFHLISHITQLYNNTSTTISFSSPLLVHKQPEPEMSFLVPDKPDIHLLEKWHYPKKRYMPQPFPPEWAEAIKPLLLRRIDELIADSWPSYWVFPQQSAGISVADTALFFDIENHPLLAYRLGYTYAVLYRYVKRVPTTTMNAPPHPPLVRIHHDPFLGLVIPGNPTQTHAIRIEEFLKTFKSRLVAEVLTGSLKETTHACIKQLYLCLKTCEPLVDDFIVVEPSPDYTPFEQGLKNANSDLETTEALEA